MLERGSRAAHYGTGCRIPIRSHSRCNRWGGLGPVETRAEGGTSDKTASISRYFEPLSETPHRKQVESLREAILGAVAALFCLLVINSLTFKLRLKADF